MWGTLMARVRDLSRLAHGSMRGWDREHFLQLLASATPILYQHLRSGWNGPDGNIKNMDAQRLSELKKVNLDGCSYLFLLPTTALQNSLVCSHL